MAQAVTEPITLAAKAAAFGAFAYREQPYCRRNWGHPLHSLCSYPSKLKPGLAHILVRTFTAPGDTVLDPFAGVGTVPFEACQQGRRGIGTDLSPFAQLVTAAKVDPPDVATTTHALDELAEVVQGADADLDAVEPEIRSFFHDDTCREVLAAREFLRDPQTPAQRVLSSALAHILHGNRPYALSRRSHGIIPIPPRGEFEYKPLMRSLREKVARLKLDEIGAGFKTGESWLSDAGTLAIDTGSVDAILTSPPFLGTTEFLRQNRVRLWYAGMPYEDQRRDKAQFLEYHKDLSIYAGILDEWARVLRPGGTLVMHVGVVKNRDMARELEPYALAAGFETPTILYEPADHLETHGRTDRGATHTHQFLIAARSYTVTPNFARCCLARSVAAHPLLVRITTPIA